MNRKDEWMKETILKSIYQDPAFDRMFILQRNTLLARTNVVLLKGLLEDLGLSGMFLAVNRPYHYMKHLLDIQKVDQRGLLYIDVICNQSGDRFIRNDCTVFTAGPFRPHFLRGMRTTVSGRSPSGEVDLGKYSFFIIDNVAAFNQYCSPIRFREFILETFTILQRFDIRTFMVIDRDLHPGTYRFLTRLDHRELALNMDEMKKSVIIEKSRCMGRRVKEMMKPLQIPKGGDVPGLTIG